MSRSGSSLPNAGLAEQSGCSCGTGACRSTRLESSGSALPTDPAARKSLPVGTGVLDYFPLALVELARVSYMGQQQHNTKGWDRSKSTDHADALVRHFLERGSVDSDGCGHTAKMAWRALAMLQEECEARAPFPSAD